MSASQSRLQIVRVQGIPWLVVQFFLVLVSVVFAPRLAYVVS
jgi:hypothetical protein